jgi:hypothetical protein
MLLFGRYDIDNIINTFQGQFGFRQTKDEYVIDYYQLRFRISTGKYLRIYLLTRNNEESLLFETDNKAAK